MIESRFWELASLEQDFGWSFARREVNSKNIPREILEEFEISESNLIEICKCLEEKQSDHNTHFIISMIDSVTTRGDRTKFSANKTLQKKVSEAAKLAKRLTDKIDEIQECAPLPTSQRSFEKFLKLAPLSTFHKSAKNFRFYAESILDRPLVQKPHERLASNDYTLIIYNLIEIWEYATGEVGWSTSSAGNDIGGPLVRFLLSSTEDSLNRKGESQRKEESIRDLIKRYKKLYR